MYFNEGGSTTLTQDNKQTFSLNALDLGPLAGNALGGHYNGPVVLTGTHAGHVPNYAVRLRCSYAGRLRRSRRSLGVTATLPSAPTLGGSTAYGYDVQGRLTGEQSTQAGGYTNAFHFDGGSLTGAGNLTTLHGQSHTYNADNQDSANTYDGSSNPTTYKGISLTYDAKDHPTAFGSLMMLGYTGSGLRAWKQGAGGKTYFLYDGAAPAVNLILRATSRNVESRATFGTDNRHYRYRITQLL